MHKPRSRKFWIVFWSISVVFLAVWTIFWQVRERGIQALAPAINILPLDKSQKADLGTLLKLADVILMDDGRERTYMIMFQNSMEIRPGGGYLGTFAIVKIKNRSVVSMKTNDLSNFDKLVKSNQKPPYPLEDILHLTSWKLRDSNFSPDFAVNAKKAQELYNLGGGPEDLDGVIAVNSDILTSVLEVTGPVKLPDYPGTYSSENAILALEYQVEKGYAEQGIEKEDRKSIMNELAEEILKKISDLTVIEKYKLAKLMVRDLERKDIQIYFEDENMEKSVEEAGWAGLVDSGWDKDYLMMVDANIGAWKTDYYMKRSFEYTVDLSKGIPTANLKINYSHGGKVRDWMTKNYLTYLRVYVPEGSWFTGGKNVDDTKFGQELSKKYFGALIWVPLGQQKTVEYNYTLPKMILENSYDLLIQKQSGISEIPGKIIIIGKDGGTTEKIITIEKDWKLSEN